MKLTHRFQFRLHPIPPYNFQLTVHKPAGWSLFTPFELYEQDRLWTAFHLDDRLVGLKLWPQGTARRPLIIIDAFTRRPCPQAQRAPIRDALAARLSVSEDLSGFYRMARRDPILRHTLANLYGMHDTGASHLFAAAMLAVLLQMAPLKRSEQMMDCVIRNFGKLAQFDGRLIRVVPMPRRIAQAGVQGLRRCRLGYRAKYSSELRESWRKANSPRLRPSGASPPNRPRPNCGSFRAWATIPPTSSRPTVRFRSMSGQRMSSASCFRPRSRREYHSNQSEIVRWRVQSRQRCQGTPA